jgi:hypothetical protein
MIASITRIQSPLNFLLACIIIYIKCRTSILLLKDMIAVMQPMSAPIRRERVKMPKKSPNARKKACVSKPPVPDW